MRWRSLLQALGPNVSSWDTRLTIVGLTVLLAVAWGVVVRPAVREVASGELLDIAAVVITGVFVLSAHRALDIGD